MRKLIGAAPHHMWMRIIGLAAAGAVGALCRHALSSWVQRHSGTVFPWGTFAVNMLGCLAFGLIWGLAEQRHLIGPGARAVLLTGFMGAFTTFSSFAYENAQLLRHEHWGLLLANLALQNLIGVALVLAGLHLTRAPGG